ncbi:Molybdopterin adenylyltransferase [Candidatus Methanoperedenaceae archaeon GB37]|nr:Molybdopterin adenylyltransferase [Candidatus Methanoperedenaceae archaeon GB37]
MSTREHKKETPKELKFAIITISTSRYNKTPDATDPDLADDGSGRLMTQLVKRAGHRVTTYALLPDEIEKIRATLERIDEDETKPDLILISGGTGIAPNDKTIEATKPLFKREIPGFGELFRELSREEVGTATILSRATAGITEKNTIIFCLPGSPEGVKLALTKIILPEAKHLTKHARGE